METFLQKGLQFSGIFQVEQNLQHMFFILFIPPDLILCSLKHKKVRDLLEKINIVAFLEICTLNVNIDNFFLTGRGNFLPCSLWSESPRVVYCNKDAKTSQCGLVHKIKTNKQLRVIIICTKARSKVKIKEILKFFEEDLS